MKIPKQKKKSFVSKKPSTILASQKKWKNDLVWFVPKPNLRFIIVT